MENNEMYLRAKEVERLVDIAKENDISIAKQEYLYLCSLVFSNPYSELAKMACGSFGGRTEEPKKEVKDERVDSI